MKYSADDREQLRSFVLENPDEHIVFDANQYKPDGNVQITVNHLTYLLHRWLYEELISEVVPPYLLPDCEEGRRCQNPYHRKISNAPTPARGRAPRNRATSEAPSAAELNAMKTHCPANHEYTPENTYIWVDKDKHRHRKCRACTIKRTRAQHRAEAKARQERK